ncbi:MAG: protein phosphatase CheZ, partial [Sphingomonadales bacterium]
RSAVNEQIMRIFEACSFQDITGQRISKVVETLTYIEDRASQIRSILGVTDDDTATASPMDPSDNDDSQLLSGPALDGEGIDQNAIDALLQDDAAPKPLKDTKAAAAPARTGRKAKPRPVKSTPEKDEADADPKGSNTQDEIDALFG